MVLALQVGVGACLATTPAAGQGMLRGALVEATPGLPPFPSGRRWRLSDAVGTPPWLRWVIEHRARVEHLGPDYRVGAHTATALMLRTSVAAELRWRDLVVGAELLDARAPFASEHTPLSNGSVNPLDVLEGYVGLVRRGALVRGDTLAVTVGRFTLNVGNRRLVARNEFRNTVNAFTGVHASWRSPRGAWTRAFAAVPVQRLPTDAEALRAATLQRDTSPADTLLLGVTLGRPTPVGATEAYLFGLLERDTPGAPTLHRRLLTAGVRVHRLPARGHLDHELEVCVQAGRSRSSTRPADAADLAHRAAMFHAELGYTTPTAVSLRVALVYDHASGDLNPADDRNNRFDPLFGARRFDLTPTGLFGALPRSNLRAAALRAELTLPRGVDVTLVWRAAWLASATDGWSAGGLRDPSGASGTSLGHQPEARVRWAVRPGNLALEVGGAGLLRGAFARQAPSGGDAPGLYLYTQLTATL